MDPPTSINGKEFQPIDGYVVGSMIFPKGDFQAAVLSIVPENRAGERHPKKLDRLAGHTEAWDERVIELLTVADLETPELIKLIYTISGTPPSTRTEVDSYTTPLSSFGKPTLGTYMNIRILFYITADGELQIPAAIADTRNVLASSRDVILHRNGEPVLGIFYNDGRLYRGIGQINHWTRRIFDEHMRRILAQKTIPYDTRLDDTQRFFAPGQAIGLETRLH